MSSKNKIPFAVGDAITCSKTVSETDVYLFAGITGDFNKVHLNEQYMKTTRIGTRIAHGGLTLSIAGGTQSAMLELKKPEMLYVSLGYDKARFLKPVYFGGHPHHDLHRD